jgi:hypothetical protein
MLVRIAFIANIVGPRWFASRIIDINAGGHVDPPVRRRANDDPSSSLTVVVGVCNTPVRCVSLCMFRRPSSVVRRPSSVIRRRWSSQNMNQNTEFEQLISASLLRVRMRAPFFATLALFASVRASREVAQAATDGYDVLVHPENFRNLSAAQQDATLLHTVLPSPRASIALTPP